MRSDQQYLSRYSYGGTSQVTGNMIGWWERSMFASSPTDVPFTITKTYELRPDKLAYDMYGKASLMWFILQYNNIVDLNEEFVSGKTILLPTKTRVFTDLLKKQNVNT